MQACGADFADTTVAAGGVLSERKGVNVPEVLLPISALTAWDRTDPTLPQLGVDWSRCPVQRPEDMQELREIVKGRAGVLAKLEKPAAIERLDAIVALSDAVMVARGDLGVEMPAEQVPRIQKCIVRACRDAGKPVIVATQMLESMINSPVPTRAEASDVATAIYDGADAVMLSAESASGQYPCEAVAMMDRIIAEVERDPHYRTMIDASHSAPETTVADAIARPCAPDRKPGAGGGDGDLHPLWLYQPAHRARTSCGARAQHHPRIARRAPARAGLGRALGACEARRQRRAGNGRDGLRRGAP